MKKMLLSLAVAVLTLPVAQAQTLWEIIQGSEVHNTLETAIETAGLVPLLDSEDTDVTVWAPNDAAFDALPPGVLDDLLADPEGLGLILSYHVTVQTYFSTELETLDGTDLPTLLGFPVTIGVDGGVISVNDSEVISPLNIDGEFGGVVHTIDAVMLPPDICTEFLFETANLLPQAPTQVDGLCNTVQSGAEVWASELYVVAGFEAGITYEVDLCSGPGAGTWNPEITVFDEGGNFLYIFDEGCGPFEFTVPADGTYSIGVNEIGACGGESDFTGPGSNNGFLRLTCQGVQLDNSIYNIIANSEDHNTLEAAIDAAGLDAVLSAPGDFTVFAPTDAAFDLLGDAVADLLADPNGALTNVLLYHVVGGTTLSGDLSDGMEIVTQQGETVTVTFNSGDIFINGAQVILPDLEGDNGVVHVIDAVLLPELCTTFANGPFGDFNTAGGAPQPDGDGVCEPIDEFTFGAFASEAYAIGGFVADQDYVFSICEGTGAGSWDPILIVRNVATGEIIASEENCEITWTATTDDDVLVIVQEAGFCGNQSDNITTPNGSPVLNCVGTLPSIVDIVVNSPDHTILEDLLGQAGLVATLSGEGPFTVFAPTDEAFGNVDQATLDALTADPEGLLTQVLTYHVVPGAVFSGDLTDGGTAATVNGEELTFGLDPVTVGNTAVTANVTGPDLEASNGVVHVIDEVLIPTTLNTDHIASLGSLNIFPNPTNQQFTVDVNLVNSERVSIDLVNLVGQNVKSIDLGNRSTGLNREYIDVSGLPTGFYLMNITVGDSQVVTKVQVVR